KTFQRLWRHEVFVYQHDDSQLLLWLERHMVSHRNAMITRMKHVHYLNCQNDHHTTTRFSLRSYNTQPQFVTAIDHVLQNMINRVLMHSRSFSNYLSNFTTHTANETRSTQMIFVSGIIRKDATQISIVNSRPLEIIALSLPAVVFAQRSPDG